MNGESKRTRTETTGNSGNVINVDFKARNSDTRPDRIGYFILFRPVNLEPPDSFRRNERIRLARQIVCIAAAALSTGVACGLYAAGRMNGLVTVSVLAAIAFCLIGDAVRQETLRRSESRAWQRAYEFTYVRGPAFGRDVHGDKEYDEMVAEYLFLYSRSQWQLHPCHGSTLEPIYDDSSKTPAAHDLLGAANDALSGEQAAYYASCAYEYVHDPLHCEG